MNPPDPTWLVVGLGNPGPQYAGHRHNVGAMVIDELLSRDMSSTVARLTANKARARVATVRLGTRPGGMPGPRVVLAVPSAFMNISGGPVKALMSLNSVTSDHLIVIHDELDLPAGTIRLKWGGGEGGHNGLRSISAALGTKDYLRVRVGIGRPPGRMDPADFVLRDFSKAERAELPFVTGTAADAVELLIDRGLTDAQNVVHAG